MDESDGGNARSRAGTGDRGELGLSEGKQV